MTPLTNTYAVTLVPCTAAMALRHMHRQTREFAAVSLRHARKMISAAFPNGVDDSGEWFVESVKQVED